MNSNLSTSESLTVVIGFLTLLLLVYLVYLFDKRTTRESRKEYNRVSQEKYLNNNGDPDDDFKPKSFGKY